MLIYLLEFLLIIFFACRIKNEDNKKNIFFLIVIIMIASIIGGLRDFSIGTDVEVYAKRWFEIATKSSSINSYINSINSVEYGYLLLNYIVSRFTSNVNTFLLVLQLICNSLVFITLYNYRNRCPLWMSTLIYSCIFYCMSFNIMRQACALSIMFYSIKFLEKNDKLKYTICVLIAMSFHGTALAAGLLILLFYAISKTKSRLQFIILLLLIFICCTSLLFIKDILIIGYKIGIINERIYNYTDIFLKKEIAISIVEAFYKCFIVFVCVTRSKYCNKDSQFNQFLLISTIIEFILYQTKIFISYSERFSFYFCYISIIFIPQAFNTLSKTRNNKLIFNMLFAVLMISYWYYKYVVCGHCEVYPYKSIILGI